MAKLNNPTIKIEVIRKLSVEVSRLFLGYCQPSHKNYPTSDEKEHPIRVVK